MWDLRAAALGKAGAQPDTDDGAGREVIQRLALKIGGAGREVIAGLLTVDPGRRAEAGSLLNHSFFLQRPVFNATVKLDGAKGPCHMLESWIPDDTLDFLLEDPVQYSKA